jgi:radical SAM protein with 4Fe4S-binding SPASM domain
LGEKGLKIEEVMGKLNPEIASSDILSFIKRTENQGLIKLSMDPKISAKGNLCSPILDFLWIEVVSRCNLQCAHCYAEAQAGAKVDDVNQPGGLSIEEIKNVIDQAAALGCKRLQFTGGEPTLRPDLRDLIDYAKANGFEFIEVFTNGTLLEEQMIRFFAEKNINVAMSVYSYKAATHDAITGNLGSFEKTLNSLKLLLAYDVTTRCATVAMKQNEDELQGTSYFLSQLGVLHRPPDPVRPTGRGIDMENWPKMYGRWFMQANPSFFVNEEVYKRNRNWNSCWFGKAAVTSQGNVLPCVFARNQVAGNIKKQSLSDIIKGEIMLSYWKLTKDKVEVCNDCEYRYVCQDCRPWAYGFTGKLTAKSPRCTYNPYTSVWANAKENLSQVGECVGKSNNRSK